MKWTLKRTLFDPIWIILFQNFSRGYCVNKIGLDEEKIRKYVKYQEDQEKKEEQ